MSKALNIAELIRTRLLTPPLPAELSTPVDLSELPDQIIVDQQKNITSMVKNAVGKARGTAVTILYTGFGVIDPAAATPRLGNRYTVRVHSKPIIAGDEWLADDVVESVVKRLWKWDPGNRLPQDRCEIRGGDLIPDTKFLIYEIDLSFPSSL